MSIIAEIGTRLVVADGDNGALLAAEGLVPNSCVEAFCVENPGLVADGHRAFAEAGAEIIRTNSFGANGLRLAALGLGDHVNEINWQAAQIARQAVKGLQVAVAGSVGPLPANDLPRKEVAAIFREQIGALLDGGAQLIFFEAFPDIESLLVALEVKYSLHHCPAICSLAFTTSGTLADGTTLAAAFAKLVAADADILGITGSSFGSCEALATVSHALSLPSPVALSLSRSPQVPLTPEEYSAGCDALARLGAGLMAGGAGIEPRHIAACFA